MVLSSEFLFTVIILIFEQTGKLLLVDVPGKNVRAADLKGSSSPLGRLSQKWMGKSTEQEKLLLAATLPDFNSAVSSFVESLVAEE